MSLPSATESLWIALVVNEPQNHHPRIVRALGGDRLSSEEAIDVAREIVREYSLAVPLVELQADAIVAFRRAVDANRVALEKAIALRQATTFRPGPPGSYFDHIAAGLEQRLRQVLELQVGEVDTWLAELGEGPVRVPDEPQTVPSLSLGRLILGRPLASLRTEGGRPPYSLAMYVAWLLQDLTSGPGFRSKAILELLKENLEPAQHKGVVPSVDTIDEWRRERARLQLEGLIRIEVARAHEL